jgi:hypothetical protein
MENMRYIKIIIITLISITSMAQESCRVYENPNNLDNYQLLDSKFNCGTLTNVTNGDVYSYDESQTIGSRWVIKAAAETDPIYSAWDKDYADLINQPTIPSAIWTLNGADTYYSAGGVAIGSTAPLYSSSLSVVGSVYMSAGNDNLFLNRSGNTTFTGSNNIGIGTSSLQFLTSGLANVGVGYESLQALTTGSDNFALSGRALETLTTGTNNVGIGFRAGGSIDVAASYNMSIGTLSLGNASGNNNVGVGYYAGYGSTGNTVAIGYFAGFTGSAGSVAIGYNAGRNNTVSNRLYIDNSSTATPLLYGEFDNNKITINGDLTVTDRIGGAATKSAFFDATGQLVEGDIAAAGDVDQTLTLSTTALTISGSGGNSVDLMAGYGGLEGNFVTISSTSATQLVLANDFGTAVNTTVTNGGGVNSIEVDDAGVWRVTVSGNISSYTTDEILELEVHINGTSDRIYKIKAPDVNFSISYTYDLDLAATDEIKIYLDSTADANYEHNDIRLVMTRIN